MGEKTVGKKLLGEWSTKTIVAIAIGAALYAVLMNYGSIPVVTNTYLTTAMIVPVVVGGLYGPLPAFLTTLIGNCISDCFGGGFWIDWSLGNGVMGFFVGLMQVYGADIRKGVFKGIHIAFYSISCLLGSFLGFAGVAPILNNLIHGTEYHVALLQGLAAAITDFIMLLVLGIPVLLLLSRRFAKRSNLQEDLEPDTLEEGSALVLEEEDEEHE